MKKSELRKIYLEKRKTLTDAEVEEFSQQIFKNIKSFFDWSKIQNIHLFLQIKNKKEINTEYLIQYFWAGGKNIFIPKISGKEILSCPFTSKTILEVNTWGILEPNEEFKEEQVSFDLVVTPLLYCDSQGNRVGYGKGFYDRFFQKINPGVIKLGVNFFAPQEEIEDVFSEDIPLDYLATSSEIISFKSKSKK